MPLFFIGPLIWIVLLILLIAFIASNIVIVPQARAYVIERLGTYRDTWNTGLHFKVPLFERIARGGVREVIIAISTSVEGETTLFYLMNRLRQFPGLKITSIARGIGFGDELEYVDELTITHALLNRREIE